MNKFRLFKLKCNMDFRSSFLNIMLVVISPNNKLVIFISQNLDKHIVLYQRELLVGEGLSCNEG